MPRSQGTSRKGKPKKSEREAGMGRALAKSQTKRFKPKLNGSSRGEGMAMAPGTTHIGIETDKEKTMLSVLEMHDLADFLGQAEMANREFVSEREQFLVLDEVGTEVRNDSDIRVSWADQAQPQSDFVFKELSVPRRPAWDEDTSAEELDINEKEAFLQWRRGIAAREEQLLESGHARVTPFEKNLEVWRQLWRVMERCACVLQIVDARNPLFYVSEDLRSYAVEELGKPMLLVVNKSDYLSKSQRKEWHNYFKAKGWDHLFFSAHQEQEKLDRAAFEERKEARELPSIQSDENDIDENDNDEEESNDIDENDNDEEELNEIDGDDKVPSQPVDVGETGGASTPTKRIKSRENIGIEMPLTREELLDWLQSFAAQYNCQPDPRFDGRIQFGMVGFPNVGKSSVINVLVGSSKHTHGVVRVAVASQPGKTKHFQTLFLPDRHDMMLCDCPGLVFPSFVSNAADLIAAGVYPIAQMRDFWPVVELICQRIPREILNAHYGIHLPIKKDLGNRDIVAPPTGEDLLTTYCIARSMLAASSGVPDCQRASRIVIKDYADGRLLYNHPPPNANLKEFQRETIATALSKTRKLQEKLGSVMEKTLAKQSMHHEGHEVMESEQSILDNLEDDFDLLDLVEGFGAESDKANGGKRGKSHKTMQKWGKKGKKIRNKDPYGCHSTPDEMLHGSATSTGAVVLAGKYGKAGYTRPTSYAGPKTSTEFEKVDTIAKKALY
ncbi:50S ribosome-binding GTPase [Fragilaria crotonensis]|nr:50S ribosome-binding GTPase [Fragilaria crotonensis]